MSKPTVAVLTGKANYARIFEPQVTARLAELTNMVVHDGERPPTPEEAGKLLAQADIAITSWGSPKFNAALLDKAPSLKLVVYAAGSIKPIVTDTLYERQITITSGACVIGIGVAETALGLIIMAMKNIFEISAAVREGGWKVDPAIRSRVKEMICTTVGVVGAGHVGRYLLSLLRHFDVRILLYDPTLTPEQAEALGATLVDLDTLMKESDVVTLHAPSIPATRHMINARNLALMKDGAALVNTARGSLIDEDALYKELATGRLKAFLDVTDPEPPKEDNPLLKLPNCIVTPHIAGGVTTGLYRLGRYTLEEVERFIEGRPPLNPVRQEQLGQLA
ncbi:MAG TPA: hydroxyacid dehydrogenase [Firmicutes bacterium]|nr:hydroxyacid dehydrogenase [Bacillota bacterium]